VNEKTLDALRGLVTGATSAVAVVIDVLDREGVLPREQHRKRPPGDVRDAEPNAEPSGGGRAHRGPGRAARKVGAGRVNKSH
jgi:hypothetical protein